MPTPPTSIDVTVTLRHPGAENRVLSLALDDDAWLERLLLVPLQPHRLIGFVHPSADDLVGTRPFVLHAAFTFLSSIALRPEKPTTLRVIRGPQAIVPYEMISPVDVDVGVCTHWIWIRRQDDEFKGAIKAMLGRVLTQESDEPPTPTRGR